MKLREGMQLAQGHTGDRVWIQTLFCVTIKYMLFSLYYAASSQNEGSSKETTKEALSGKKIRD